MATDTLIDALVATAEVMGTELSASGARMFCTDLAEYPEPAVMQALAKCRREVSGKLTLAAVVARIDDGRPGPNEAWAMMPRTEAETVVWTDEMSEAMGSAQPLLEAGDQVAARVAFIEHYQRAVIAARHERRPVHWRASLGHDPRGREHILREAVGKGRLSLSHARSLLPHGVFEERTPALQGPIRAAALLPEFAE